MHKIYDAILIGGGPSALTTGNILSRSNVEFLIIESGNHLYKRDKNNHQDIVSGIGGGGLYSDGKISLYPSGSKLYLLDPTLLRVSYEQLDNILKNFSINLPSFDNAWLTNEEFILSNKNINNKNYDSIVLTQTDLYKIGFYLYDTIGKERFLVNTSVLKIKFNDNIYSIDLLDNEKKIYKTLMSRSIIFCGGKVGACNLSRYYNEIELEFKKFEFGIRIEVDHNDFDYIDNKQSDLKLLFQNEVDKNIEFRTFCFCRNGYIIQGQFENLSFFNGISNQPGHHLTNFGLNIRIKEESAFKFYKEQLNNIRCAPIMLKYPIKQFISKNDINWGNDIHNLFVNVLRKYFPKICDSKATVTGPSFEYCGYYPKINKQLKVDNQNFWVCGDSTGEFRGLLPSLVSGIFVGLDFLNKNKKDKEILYDLIRLKISPTNKTQSIFTAQSKKYFILKMLYVNMFLKPDLFRLILFKFLDIF